MPNDSTLNTLSLLAQIGLGITAFASLLSFIVSGDRLTHEDIRIFRSIVALSLTITFNATFPFLLLESGVSEPQIWQYASLLFGICSLWIFGRFCFDLFYKQTHLMFPLVSVPLMGVCILAVAMLIRNAFIGSASLYCWGLYAALAVTAWRFYLFMVGLMEARTMGGQ